MSDGYFYTLSAIAQLFAAIVVLNAVFVIYKFQLLKSQRDELIKQLRQLWLQEKSPYKSPYSERNKAAEQVDMMTDENILSFCRGVTDGRSEIVKRFKETLEAFDANNSLSEKITKWVKVTLILNTTTILLSLLFLPWKNLIPNFLQYTLLIIVLSVSIFALFVTIHAILITLESGELSLISKIFGEKR